MRKERKIDHLSGLSNDQLFGEVAAAMPLLIENAYADLNSANVLAGHAPGRCVGHLRSVAEEEADEGVDSSRRGSL